MRMIKRFLLILVLGMLFINTVSYNHVKAATESDAMNWCENLLNKKVGTGQCVALIQSYYEYLGKSRVSGNACDYATNALPSGWSRVKGGVPKAGDVLVYVGAKYGHVAIYAGGTTSYHQNMSGKYVEKKTNWAYNKSWYSSAEGGTKTYWGYIRPDFDDPDPSYSDFSISKTQYKLKEKIEFKINPINTTGFGISIDKEGVGRVVSEGCNGTNGTRYGQVNLE